MRRSSKMRRLKGVAELEERQALQVLQTEQTQLAAAASQQQQLVGYQQEYADRLRQTGRISASLLGNFQKFFGGLNQAVQQQQDAVSAQTARVSEHRVNWQATWNRKNAIEKVADSLADDETRELDKREQKAVNDMAGSHHGR